MIEMDVAVVKKYYTWFFRKVNCKFLLVAMFITSVVLGIFSWFTDVYKVKTMFALCMITTIILFISYISIYIKLYCVKNASLQIPGSRLFKNASTTELLMAMRNDLEVHEKVMADIEDEVLESTEKIWYDLIRDYHLSFWSMESMFELVSSLESTNKLSDDSNISKFIDEQYEIKIELEKLFFDSPGALSLLKNNYSTLDKYR